MNENKDVELVCSSSETITTLESLGLVPKLPDPIESVVYTKSGPKAVWIEKPLESRFVAPYLPEENLVKYSDLSSSFGEARVSKNSYRVNAQLALLGQWVEFLEKTPDMLIGADLSSDFEKHLSAFQSHLLSQKKSKKTVQNSASLMRNLQAHYMLYRLKCMKSMPTDFRSRLVYLMATQGVRVETLAKDKLIGRGVKDWIKPEGSLPQKHRYSSVERVEDVLKVPRGTLISTLPRIVQPIMKLNADTEHRNYAHGLSRDPKYHYYLKEFPPQLEAVWQKVKQHKMSASVSVVCEKTSTRTMLPVDSYWTRESTATLNKEHLSRFFGYLLLPKNDDWEFLTFEEKLTHGRYGLKLDELEFAHLYDSQKICDFLEYVLVRGGTNAYAARDFDFMNCIINLISKHRKTAFFRVSSSRASLLGLPTDGFGDWLDRTYDVLNQTRRSVEKMVKSRVYKGALLADLLKEPDYIDRLFDMATFILDCASPFAVSPYHYSKAFRDSLIVEILIYRPFRVCELKSMKIGETLIQNPDGSWTFFFPKKFLKNHHSPHALDIRETFPEGISKMISQYVEKFRPAIVAGSTLATNSLFITGDAQKGALPMSAQEISRRFATHFQRFFKLSIGAHAMRDLVATAYLKKFPGDFPTVAAMLNNSVKMARDHYDKTTRHDAEMRAQAFRANALTRKGGQ